MQIRKLGVDNIDQIILESIKVLESGGIIIYPTETTYGMGVDPTNQSAVERLLSYKEKREGKALSIAVDSIDMAKKYVEINNIAENIYRNFLPGPVTVISKSKNIVADNVASSTNTLGIRIPNHQLILKLLTRYGKGITATSANPSGGRRPYKVEDILEQISERQKKLIDLIIDAGELPHNNPSTVIDTVSGVIETLRFGDRRFDLEGKFVSKSVENTIHFGEKLGLKIKNRTMLKPIIIAIQGQLGAGKTHFAGGVAKGLGIIDLIKSPTFLLCNEYKFDKNRVFYHIDTYRMLDEKELLDLGFEDMILGANVILIEWAERVIPVLDQYKYKCDFIWLRFENVDESTREIWYDPSLYK